MIQWIAETALKSAVSLLTRVQDPHRRPGLTGGLKALDHFLWTGYIQKVNQRSKDGIANDFTTKTFDLDERNFRPKIDCAKSFRK
ncbi:hypothetical protein PoB_005646800 [Plakobranchus ocellatus]|uniref:Uncharacterized protein n=1 Tax=Plakobranchus ocellatus TaxID=259542 RepID=A0AAV4CDH8_9GAST|nr:hypothetical protein PoB_005646800 [Plakobranchus ocellatus]